MLSGLAGHQNCVDFSVRFAGPAARVLPRSANAS